MKLGDVIEVTRSRISRYAFEENESVVSAEAVASAANGSNSKATYFPDLEVHAMPVA
jgi:hypothetical protein